MLTLEDHLEMDKISHFKCKPNTKLCIVNQSKEYLLLIFLYVYIFKILSKIHDFFASVYPSTSAEASLSSRALQGLLKTKQNTKNQQHLPPTPCRKTHSPTLPPPPGKTKNIDILREKVLHKYKPVAGTSRTSV